jgi:hypothetical protein
VPTAEEYRIKAADMDARAKRESTIPTKAEYQNLALAYLRLAEQAEKNAATDLVYETPPPLRHAAQQAQQQQQGQPKKKKT